MLDSIEFTDATVDFLKRKIHDYLRDGHPVDVLVANWEEIQKLGRDSSSLRSYILRYGDDLGQRMFQEKTQKSTITKDHLVELYGYEDAFRRLSKRGCSLENFISRHGKEQGQKQWDEYCEKRARTYAQGRLEGRYASRDLAWFQSKYGEKKGYDIWDKKRRQQAYKVSKQYYIDQYGAEKGEKLCRLAKARDLDFYIRKYGEDEGNRRHLERTLRMAKVLRNRKSFSSWSIKICETLKKEIPDLFYFGSNELIWQLPEKFQDLLGQRCICPDLFYRGKVIEFHGDVFHGNPELFQLSDQPHPFNNLTTNELHARDRLRAEYYQSKGYQVLEVWEKSFITDPEETVNLCLTFLTSTTK